MGNLKEVVNKIIGFLRCFGSNFIKKAGVFILS